MDEVKFVRQKAEFTTDDGKRVVVEYDYRIDDKGESRYYKEIDGKKTLVHINRLRATEGTAAVRCQ